MVKLAVLFYQSVAVLAVAPASAGMLPFRMLPGQSFSSWPKNTTWHYSTWSGACVVKIDPTPDKTCCPYAVVDLPNETACPVGQTFDASREAEALPWAPYPSGTRSETLVFNGTKRALLDPLCNDERARVANRDLLNAFLAELVPGDTLVIPRGTFCLAAGVVGNRLSHVTLDIQGDLFFAQDHKHWSNVTDGTSYAHAMLFRGLTNVTLTSTTRTGIVRAKGCTDWYLQRLLMHVPGPPPLIEVGADAQLTFASSHLVFEHLTVRDGPNWQTYFNKVTDVVIRHVKVEVSCSRPGTEVGNMLGALAENTDGIDIFGSNVHVHDVYVRNADDCICVKGDNDGSRIWSENWLVENSTASGEGLSVGTMWSGNFVTRNVTFRNIIMPNTRKGIYVKIDTHGNSAEVRYENITLTGHTLQFPVFIGPIHQFGGDNCPFIWPWFKAGYCGVNSDAKVNISIDGLRIERHHIANGVPLDRTADFLIAGNEHHNVAVTLSNVVVDGKTKTCDDPPLSKTGTCGNACFSADVEVLDGSVDIACTPFNTTVEAGACAPLLGTTKQRCRTGSANKSSACGSGWVCV